MCYAVTCSICGKKTWAGCGQHVESVRRSVPAAQWCAGHSSSPVVDAEPRRRGGFFSTVFGR